jgi:arylsulfatase A-like enzyme
MNVLCLLLDRLHLGYLGPYGNSWIDTPQFDLLATQAFLFDQALLDTPRLDLLYRSFWQGWHALNDSPLPEDRLPLARLLDDRGVHTVLFTDEPEVLNHPAAEAFREYREIEPTNRSTPAEALEETHLAQCFAQLISHLDATEPNAGPQLLWCHLAGMGTAWDAPEELRWQYVQEGDPDPSSSIAVPRLILPKDHDPALQIAASNAYAAQIGVLDTCLGALLEFLDESPLGRETLLIVAGARGFPLGEHRRLGPCDNALYSPLVHVPLIIRMPGGEGASARSQALVEPSDLWATLLDCWNTAPSPYSPTGKSLLPIVRDEVSTLRQRLALRGDGTERAIRTPAWYLRQSETQELFAKPDDLWEATSVTERCQEIVDALHQDLDAYAQSLTTGRPLQLPPLDDLLLHGPR